MAFKGQFTPDPLLDIGLVLDGGVGLQQFMGFPARIGVDMATTLAGHDLGMLTIFRAGTANRINFQDGRLGVIVAG